MIRFRMLSALSIVPALLVAQSSTMVGVREGGGNCPRCTLRAEQVAVYGRPDDAELIPDSPALLRLPDGRLLVGNQRGGSILVFSPKGNFSSLLGRIGDGPGEYRNTKALFAGPGDSVTVLGANSIAVLSTRTGRGRSGPLLSMMPTALVVGTDGTMVLNSHYGRRPAFTVLSTDLQEVTGFGPTVMPDANGHIDEPIYDIALARRGGFWSVKREYVHRIERWSFGGKVLQRLDSLPSWFQPYTAIDKPQFGSSGGFSGVYRRRPVPETRAIHEDADGRVWVLSSVADPKWRPVQHVPRLESYEAFKQYQPPKDPNRHIDVIVELFSPESGALLGAWRFHRYLSGFLGPGLAYRMVQDDDGIWRAELWRFTLGGM